ncbi:MAG: rhamnose transport system ATP-binding protein [Streptosporangiaceae bacterium]|nr:rhamnose transport system ATP-binding protein [Streptosporangiaceae bacterium]
MLALRGIRKVYGATVAVDELTVALAPAQVHALVGENGAGKSTAAQIASGVTRPTAGHVEFGGREVTFGSARDAEALGIVLIPQELQLYESLSVAENMYVGRPRPRGRGRLVAGHTMRRRAQEQLARLGVTIDPASRVQELTHGNRQLVAIGRALMLDARVLIMDEPTASLDEWEAQRLLGVVSALRSSGVAVLYVSHRLPEILRIADVISVMRDGRLVRSAPGQDFDEASLVTSMLGRPLVRHAGRRTSARDEVAFESAGLTRTGVFGPVDLTIRRGEIVGMAGLIGSGRSEFAQTVIGRDKLTGGQLTVAGRPVSIRSVRQAVQRGVGYVPEERQAQGLFLALSSKSNVSMAALDRIQSWGVVSPRRESRYVRDALARLAVKGDINAPVSTLSGGTQQKVLLGRWLALQPSVLILDEPTRGIDVGTRFEIYRIIEQLTDSGVAILLISSDIQELLALSDRVVVMRAGQLVGEFSGDDLTEMNIGAAALGADASHGGAR